MSPRRSDDEAEIRRLVARWREATAAGDTAAVLDLMTDDAVFLVAGRSPMTKGAFAAISTPPAGVRAPKIDSSQRICEISIDGDLAYRWSELSVSVLPAGATTPVEREGHTLTIFRRQDGRWKLARDANLLAPKCEA